MRQYLIHAGALILLVGLTQCVQAQLGTDANPGQSRPSFFQRLWPFHKKKAPEPLPAVKTPSPLEIAAATQAREKADYLRRIAVCDKLRDIAFQTNDDELSRKADQLDQRAYAIFMNHAAQGAVANSNLQADERVLERRLGRNAPAGQSLLPTQRASGSRASLGED